MEELKALVLAAGKGVRMKSDRPKVLFEANGLPLLWYPLDAARRSGATELLVVVGAGREDVESAFGDAGVTWVFQEKQLGTGHAVMSAREALGAFEGYLLVLCGDAPLVEAATLEKLYRHTAQTGAACTILTAVLRDPTGYGRIIRGAGGVEAIVEEKCADDAQKAVNEINSGTYCFRWKDLADVLECIKNDNPQGEYLLTDAVALLIERGALVAAMASDRAEEGLGVNDRAQLAVVSRALRMRVLERLMAEGVSVEDPETAFIDPRAEIGVDTVIRPFVVIEGPVKIGANCRIGPFTHVRGEAALSDGVRLGNFVEVKKSSFGAGSRAMHLAFVGDSTVGADANIAAGVITANSDGKERYVTQIGDGASVGAGTIFVAPCRMAAGSATGAGAVVTKGREVPGGDVWVGVPAGHLEKGGKKDG